MLINSFSILKDRRGKLCKNLKKLKFQHSQPESVELICRKCIEDILMKKYCVVNTK